jgi:uncharacterized repeat protein (TIGR01451 family)
MAVASTRADPAPSLAFDGPAEYTPGMAGHAYTLTVGNTGSSATGDLSVTTQFPADATVSFSCSASGTGSSCGSGPDSGNLDRDDVQVGPGGEVTFAFQVAFAPSMTNDPLLVQASAGSLQETVSSSLRLESDVAVVKSSGETTYTPGASGSYTLVVSNAGPSDVSGVGLQDTAPAGMQVSAWTCTPSTGASCPASGSGDIDLPNLAIPAGGTLSFALTVAYDAAATADPIVNTATITVPASANDPDTDNHSGSSSKARAAVTDLSVAFSPAFPAATPGTYVPGLTTDVTLTARNDGPSQSSGATVTIVLPVGASGIDWSCAPAAACAPSAGSSAEDFEITLPGLGAGQQVAISLGIAFASSALEQEIQLAASIAAEEGGGDVDPTPANDSASNHYRIERRADIRVAKTSGPDEVSPGSSFDYTIRIDNLGPSDVGNGPGELGILLTDLFPNDKLRGSSAACGGTNPSICFDICESDDGEVGDFDSDDCPVEPQRESGDIIDRAIRLSAGSSTTVRAHVTVRGTATGTIVNTATVALAEPEIVLLNPGTGKSSTDTLQIVVGTDIRVTKTDGVTSAVPGTVHGYTVRVHNDGFITANNVAVTDAMPLYLQPGDAGFVPGSISWQCRAFDGACCNHNSTVCGTSAPTAAVFADVLNAAVDLPPQSRVEFTLTGLLDPRAVGTLENAATATLPPGISDPNPGNNTAVDDDTVLSPQANLGIVKRLLDISPEPAPPFDLTYEIVVSNNGPSYVAGASITDTLESALLVASSAQWSCETLTNPGATACLQSSGTGPLLVAANLDPGGSVRILLEVATTSVAAGAVVNTATVSSPAGSAAVTISSGLSGLARLQIDKTDNRSQAVPGTENEYVITLRNLGPDDVFGARVRDAFPPELEGASWTCEATTPVPGQLTHRETVGGAGFAGDALAISSDGRHIYLVGRAANSLFVFSRDNVPGLTFGRVTPLETETDGVNDPQDPGGTVTGMRGPVDVALTPDGAMVYVLSRPAEGNPAIAAFGRVTDPANPNFGRVTFFGSVSTGLPAHPRRLVATQQNIYVSGDQGISIYRRDAVSGMPVHDMLHLDGVPADPGPMAVSGGTRLLVASTSAGALARFDINTTAGATPIGRLSPAGSLSGTAIAGADALALAPGGEHLYVRAAGPGRLTQVLLGPSLALGLVYAAADLDLPPGMGDPLVGPGRIAVALDGEHLLATSGIEGALLNFRRDLTSGGLGLEDVRRLDVFSDPGLDQPAAIAITGDGRHALIANAAGGGARQPLTVYARRAPDPRFAFLERDRQGDPVNGGSISGLLSPVDVAVSRDGRHVYAVSLADNALTVFNRFATRGSDDATAGQHLEFVTAYFEGQGGIVGLAAPTRVHVSPDGRSVHVSSQDNGSLAVFARDDDPDSPSFGRLTFLQVLRDGQGGVTALLGAHGMAMDADSRHLYVAASFEAAIGVFAVNADRTLGFIGEARGGVGGAIGLAGVRDLVVTRDRNQVLAVGAESNAALVFQRNNNSSSADFGRLSFRQALSLTGGQRPVSIAIPGALDPADVDHVYVVAQNSNTLHVLRRNLDPTSPAFGTLNNLFVYAHGSGGIQKMRGPRDVAVSADGRRVYVASQIDHSVLAFDRDTNRSSGGFGGLALAEVRSDAVDGVDGINSVYAVAVSGDSRNVYAAGFGDSAIASFVVGSGSSCSATGGGDIDELVDIGVGGTLVFRARARIRPDATGVLVNSASVELPERFSDPDTGETSQSASDSTILTPLGDLSISKTNNQVSVVAGETVVYEVVVRNAGPSNLAHAPAAPVTVTDILSTNPAFVPDSISWTCIAAGSGALDFIDVFSDTQPGIDGLGGVSGLALVPDTGILPGRFLAAASVLDSSVTLFARDPADGRLTQALRLVHGGSLNGQVLGALEGARSVLASADGRHLYVAARTSDAVNAFSLSDAGGSLAVELVDVKQGYLGLDQALHMALSPDGAHLYVAGANDNAIAVFARNADTGALTWIESKQNGAVDPGGTVAGLENVEFLVVSPDGAHLYALSATSGSVARFDRDPATGALTWRSVRNGGDLGVPMQGVSSAVFEPDGEYLYLTASISNRVIVLRRNTQSGSGSFGALSLASSVAQGVAGTQGLLSPRRAALSGDARHLYVTAQSGAAVSWFIRDPADGSLRFLGLRSNESAGVDGLLGATGVVIDDELNQVYVAGTLQGAIAQFERQVDSFCPPSGSGDIDALPVAIAAGGSLTFRIQVQVANNAVGLVTNTARVDSPLDTTPENSQASDTDVVSVVADLAITKDDGLAEFDGLDGARAVAGDLLNVYVAGAGDNAIGVFRRRHEPGAPEHGRLRFQQVLRSAVDGVAGLGGVADLLLHASGVHLYAASPVENSVSLFRRAPEDGRLTHVQTLQNGVLGVTGIAGARALAASPDGRHLYVAGGFSNAVAVFERDDQAGSANYGRLTFRGMAQNAVGGVEGLDNPSAVVVSPDGKHVYALGENADSVVLFQRNTVPGSSGFGLLSFVARYANGAGGLTHMDGPVSLRISADGAHVYVLARDSGSIVRFARNADSGQLAVAAVARDGEGGVAGLAGAARIRLSPDGAHLYVAARASNAIGHFLRDGSSGDLGFAGLTRNGDPAPGTGGQVIGLGGASDVLVPADGAQLYAVARDDDALTVFDRDAGALDYRDVFFDGLGGVAPGESVTYLITVSNHGPSDVSEARVVDIFPPEFESVEWVCEGSANPAGQFGECPAFGLGNIDTLVRLPAGSKVTFAATGVVSAQAGGRLVNTATVSGVGVIDPDPSNNSATDDDTVLSPAMDLVVNFAVGGGTATPGDLVAFDLTVANLGPSYATAARVHDLVPAAMHSVAWTCHAEPVAGILDPVQGPLGTLESVSALSAGSLGQFVYATGSRNGRGALAVYRRDPLTGTLSERQVLENGIGGVSGIAGAAHLVLSGDERFVYVAGRDSDAIAVFARDPASGDLSFLARYVDNEFGVDGIGGVRRLLLGPGGSRLYAAGSLDDAIAVFAVNASTGLLTPSSVIRQSQPGVDGLNGVAAMAFTADAAHLLAVAVENQSLSAFARHPTTGALTHVATVLSFQAPAGALLGAVDLAVSGERIFVAARDGDQVAEFRFEAGATPAFRLERTIADGTGGISGLAAPEALLFEPDQARLYVAGDSRIHLIGLLGEEPEALATYPAASFPALAGVAALAQSPNRRQLYAGGDGLGVFARERGSRCPVAGGRQLATQTVDIAPGGTLSYRVEGRLYANASGVLSYRVQADTQLADQELNPADNVAIAVLDLVPAPDLSVLKRSEQAEVVAGLGIDWVIEVANAGVSDALEARVIDTPPLYPDIDPGVLADDFDWTCEANLPLSPEAAYDAASVPGLAGASSLALAPDGAHLFATNAQLNALLVFPREPDGSLGAPQTIVDGASLGDATVSGLGGASHVAVTLDGRSVLVTGQSANSLAVFARDPSSGALSFQQRLTSGQAGVSGLTQSVFVTASSDGRAVYVGSRGAPPVPPAIAVFRRNLETGQLSFVERVADGLGTILPDSNVLFGVRRLLVSEDGRHLYAVASQSNAVSSFAVNPQTGKLQYLGALRQSQGIAGLQGARALAATPGDEQVYVLGAAAIARFLRGGDGRLVHQTSVSGIPGLGGEARVIAMRPDGSRLYLADDLGALHVFARDWNDGGLEHRYRLDHAVANAVGDMVYAEDRAELYLSAPQPGALAQVAELALSRCLTETRVGPLIDETLDLGVGGQATLAFAATVHPSARGVLENTATVEPGSGADPDPDNNSATSATPIVVIADIAVEKSGPEEAVAGTTIDYEIRVTNAGPSSALGVQVVDILHPALLDASWTCSASEGSSCPPSGLGNVILSADILPEGEVTILLSARIAPSFVGTLTNSVGLVPEPGAIDPTPGDHSDEVETGVTAVADVFVAKDNGVDSVVAGTDVTWTITVGNSGPSDAPQVRLVDQLASVLSNGTWSCQGFDGASCPPAGSGSLDFLASIPANASVVVELTARLAPSATGFLSNTAVATVLGDVEDPQPDNNASTDIDVIEVRPDLWLRLIDPLNPFDSSGDFDLPVVAVIRNLGPSDSSGGELVLEVDPAVTQTFDPTCVAESSSRLRCPVPPLKVSESFVLRVDFGNLPLPPETLTVDGEVIAADDDPELDNNLDSVTIQFLVGGDVLIYVENGLTSLIPGRQIGYRVLVINIGSQPVTDVQVDVPVAAGLLNAAWSCLDVPANLCQGSGSGDIVASFDMPPSARAEFLLSAVVDPFIDPLVQPTIAQMGTASVPPGSDINLDNNVWVDEDPLVSIIFADGFETLEETAAPAPKSAARRIPAAFEDSACAAGVITDQDPAPGSGGLQP